MRLAPFDPDRTLLDGDSDQLWCGFLVERGVLPRESFASANAAMAQAHARGEVGASGDRVVLTTATCRHLAKLSAARLRIADWIATECAIDAQGRFSGRAPGTPNMRERKGERLHAWLAGQGLRLQDCDAALYRDSANDLPLLQAVAHPMAVYPDARLARRAQERGWPVIGLR